MTEVECPLDECKTDLQRAMHGNLVDGVTAHLVMVHKMGEEQARALAYQHVWGDRS